MKFFYVVFCFSLLALVACSDNIFGSGEGGTDIRSLRLDAENAFRSGNYKKAYNICSAIVAKDSTVSFGYLGMAKARLWDSGVNPLEIFSHVKTDEENEIPFANEEPYVQNKYLQGMTGVKEALSLLYRRDSLTWLYELHQRSIKEPKWDSLFTITVEINGEKVTMLVNLEERLRDFRKAYSRNYSIFPLSDREFRSEYFGSILFISSVTKGLLEVFDINKNGCIARRGKVGIDNPGDPKTNPNKWEEWGCKKPFAYDVHIGLEKDENGNFMVNLSQVVADLGLDDEFYRKQAGGSDILPEEIADINNRLEDFTGDMDEIIELMDILGLGREPEEEGGDWKQDINKYKDQTIFYKIGTRIDEDGDGCIDEDIMDGQDNDGDGLKDANARLASTDTNSPYYANDGLMGFHGMTGNPEDDKPLRFHITDPKFIPIANDPDRWFVADLIPDENGYVTVIAFTQKPGYWTSPDADIKLIIAQDTVCPPKFSLVDRKRLIGGCWPNYDEDKFVKYWLKRGLARKEDQERRIHPSCKTCIGTGCLR
jgi:hypothetical protein